MKLASAGPTASETEVVCPMVGSAAPDGGRPVLRFKWPLGSSGQRPSRREDLRLGELPGDPLVMCRIKKRVLHHGARLVEP